MALSTKLVDGRACGLHGDAENAGLENAGLENTGPNRRGGKGRTGKRGSIMCMGSEMYHNKRS